MTNSSINTSVLTDLKKLAGSSGIYGVGTILLKSISVIMLPVYTHYLTPADYGILAVTTTITMILGVLFPLSLHGALMRFYFNVQTEEERNQTTGTLWIAIISSALVMVTLLDFFGEQIFSFLFQSVPFTPYIRIAIWSAFFNITSLVPLTLFRAQERPLLQVLATTVSTLFTVGFILFFLVFKQLGVYGFLLGMLLARIIMAVPYIVFTLQNIQLPFRWGILKAGLLFSLPLIPHNLAGWVLDLSDRVILERFVSLDDLGLYGFGYQVSSIVKLIATAMNLAWSPFIYSKLSNQEENVSIKKDLAVLVTYFAFFLCFFGTSLMLLARPVLLLLTKSSYHAAYQVIPAIVAGLLLNGLYIVPVSFLFQKKKTTYIPVITVISGIVNIFLNIWLIPMYGIQAAAWTTFLSYGIMFLIVCAISYRIYPIPYEYTRLGLILLVTIMLFVAGSFIQVSSLPIEICVKTGLVLAFPVILGILGLFNLAERQFMLSLVHKIKIKR